MTGLCCSELSVQVAGLRRSNEAGFLAQPDPAALLARAGRENLLTEVANGPGVIPNALTPKCVNVSGRSTVDTRAAPKMVAAIPRPRTGILAPLEERWADAERRLQRLDPGNTAGNRPRTEIGLDALEDAIAAAAHRAQPAPISPALQAAVQELWD